MKNTENVIWRDRKRTIFGLPLSFTVYSLTSEKLLIDTGFLNKKQEEVMLFRIMDITLERKLSQRLFGVGTIHCCSADKTTPEFEIKSVKCPQEVKETLSKEVYKARQANRVGSREIQFDGEFDEFDH